MNEAGEDMFQKISFETEGGEAIELYVIEQTRMGGVNYLLVTEEADGDGEAMILNRKEVVKVIKDLQSFLFPDYYTHSEGSENVLSQTELLLNIYNRLIEQIKGAYAFNGTPMEETPEELCNAFIERLPKIKQLLIKDIEAIYEGDPAAKCHEEVLIFYPGFYAISIFRLAHELYTLKVPLIPRIMTEFAHEKTGVDIHAGATIGEYFCIDHGTGIVIGETTTIGDRVKIYQGVTLGAKSFELDENGNVLYFDENGVEVPASAGGQPRIAITKGDLALANAHVGDEIWIISPSSLAYGIKGISNCITSRTPVLYKIKVLKKADEKNNKGNINIVLVILLIISVIGNLVLGFLLVSKNKKDTNEVSNSNVNNIEEGNE